MAGLYAKGYTCMYIRDTIAAVATAPGPGGVGIIRISGPGAREKGLKLFSFSHQPAALQAQRMYFGDFSVGGQAVDSGYLVWFQAPRSFTGEDVVEYHCHGGMRLLHSLLQALFRLGVRPAERGEFTKRAFLNGKLDLSRAEAVSDLVEARSDKALALARAQYVGKVAGKIEDIRSRLTQLLAEIEVIIDYPEMELEAADNRTMYSETRTIQEEVALLAGSFQRGRLYREGLSTVILGRPNVGKSSLLNLLSGEQKAIVTDIPGTTRDVLEANVCIGGIPLRLVDTAGFRAPGDLVEKLGVDRAREAAKSADLVLLIFDGSQILQPADRQLLKIEFNGKLLAVINKADLPQQLKAERVKELGVEKVYKISALKNQGIEELEKGIEEAFTGGDSPEGQVIISSQRHYQVLCRVSSILQETLNHWQGAPLDVLAQQLRSAWETLGEITGKTWTENLLDTIFSKFCLGK